MQMCAPVINGLADVACELRVSAASLPLRIASEITALRLAPNTTEYRSWRSLGISERPSTVPSSLGGICAVSSMTQKSNVAVRVGEFDKLQRCHLTPLDNKIAEAGGRDPDLLKLLAGDAP